MSEFKDVRNKIKEIQKKRNETTDEKEKYEEKIDKLNEKIEEYDIEISWLREDIEDIACNYFYNIKGIHINNEDNYIELKFSGWTEIRLSRIESFIDMIGQELEDCIILCDADGYLYLKIFL